MNVQEKQAWFTGVITWTAAAGFLIAGALTHFHPAAQALFSLLAFSAFSPLIGRKERIGGKIVMDERDQEIARKALVISYSIFWVCFVAACMAPFFVLGPNAQLTVPATWFCGVIWAAWCIVQGTSSLSIIIMYRRGAHEQQA